MTYPGLRRVRLRKRAVGYLHRGWAWLVGPLLVGLVAVGLAYGSEEVTRFHGHLAHWDALSDSAEPCGRKLDFLLQEMNREVNTIGSKADGLHVSEVVIQAKAELERMREQVQNVE